MADDITIRINRQKYQTQPDQFLADILKANNIDLPVFCLLSNEFPLPLHTCLVEVRGQDGLQPACQLKVEDGMRIQTNSGRARQLRREALKILLEHWQKDENNPPENQEKIEKVKAYLKTGASDQKHPEPREYQSMWPSIEIDRTLCIGCQRCVSACLQKQVGYLADKEEGGKKVVEENTNPNISCILCGQCTLECPVDAIREQSEIIHVEQAIADPEKIVIVQMAPSIRTSIGEEFGMEAGANVAPQMYTALRQLGFDHIFDVNMGADITTLVEAAELVEELKHGSKKLPMFTSCCPSWVKFLRDYYPEMVGHLSNARSPQVHSGAAYKTWWAQQQGIDPDKIVVVSIMPCTSKKQEARLDELKIQGRKPVDYVLTTRETAYLLKKNGINLSELEGSAVDKFGQYSGAAAIYGASGGVVESALRTAAWMLEGKDLPKLEFEQVRGSEGIKKAEIEIGDKKIKMAIVSTMRNARRILEEMKKDPDAYHCVEVMACPGGCIGGGGQPKPTTPEKIDQRIAGLYDIDQKSTMRKAHENQVAKDFLAYADTLPEEQKKELLYRVYPQEENNQDGQNKAKEEKAKE
ncbi:MAG: [FeFe] hydrogenase, group A [Patescibacteria group bacterium]|nr:[FeFe] hydrogenase, group A [Patescibacteria group bacterium]